jgi:YHS domain-containing protein
VLFAVKSFQMRRIALLVLALAPLGCSDAPPDNTIAAAEMRSIHTVPPQPAPLDPPPMLVDEAPPPKPKALPWETPKPIIFTPEDDKLRSNLPFTPAIAMDPINGDKISIRATTPTFEYKGRIFYFSSEENRRTFMASPDQYLKSPMMRL